MQSLKEVLPESLDVFTSKGMKQCSDILIRQYSERRHLANSLVR